MFAETQMCKVKVTENVIPVQHPFNNIFRNVLNFFKMHARVRLTRMFARLLLKQCLIVLALIVITSDCKNVRCNNVCYGNISLQEEVCL